MDDLVKPGALEAHQPLPRGRHNLDREVVLASQRGRLIAAFVELAAERGFDNVTIIDIVSLAGTSKRTFYEHFADKEDCLLQAFDTFRDMLVAAVIEQAGPIEDPVARIGVGVRAYVGVLGEFPYFTRLFLSESMSAGSTLADRWVASTEQFAALIHGWRDESRREHPEVPELPMMRAKIVLAGLNQLICMTVHSDGVDAVVAQTETIAEHAVALLTAP